MGSDKKLRTAAHRLLTDDGETPQTAQIHHLPTKAETTDPWLDLGQGPAPIVEEPDEVRQQYDKLDSNLDELAETPTVVEFEQEKRARIRMGKIILALLVLAILLGYALTWFVADNVAKTTAKTELLRGTVESLQQANQQRAAVGLPPINIQDIVDQLDQKGIGDAITTTVLVKLSTDPRYRGVNGEPGIPGLPGAVGLPGAPGEPGTPGAPGAAGQPGATGTPGTAGQPGVNGVNGANGLDGLPGPSGTEGPAGAQGAPGSQGPAGAPGEPGAQGPAGPAGETCPAPTTLQPITVLTPEGGTANIIACQ